MLSRASGIWPLLSHAYGVLGPALLRFLTQSLLAELKKQRYSQFRENAAASAALE